MKCNDINVYYEIHGEGAPLFFINGLGSDITQKMAFINAAKKYFKLIIPDLRGAGQTDKPQNLYSISQFARDAYELIKKLTPGKIDVMGFSMGGFVAQYLAINYQDIIDRLVFTSTKPAWSRPTDVSEEAKKIFYSTVPSEELLMDLFNIVYGPNYKKRVSAKAYARARMADPNPQPLHGYLGQLEACKNFDLYEEAKTIRKDTLIITGKEDQLIFPENSRWLHKNIANSKLIEYPGVGHMPVDECPEELAKDLKEFLTRNE